MPLRDLERLQTVNRFLKLNIDRNEELEEIVRLAADICNTPVALLTILDDQTQYIKFRVGFDRAHTDARDAFCQYTIQSFEITEVSDAQADHRFSANPLVTGDPHIRFYAGAPLTTQDGYSLGSLCVIDKQPRSLSDHQRKMLAMLSRQAIKVFEFELSVNTLKEQVIKARQSEIKLRSFFESTVSCHLLLGKSFEVLAFNKVVAAFISDMYGADLSEGTIINSFVHRSHVATFEASYQTALTGETIISEQELTYPDGRTIYWYIIYEPARAVDGDIIGVSYNATDITQRIHQERLILAQNESLRKIAFIQSHEIRRPVSSILGLVKLIKSEQIPPQISQEVDMLEKV